MKTKEVDLERTREYRKKIGSSYFMDKFVIPMAIKRDVKCLRCGSTKNLDIHHKHYDIDKLTYYDLETLCRLCHKKEHSAEEGE